MKDIEVIKKIKKGDTEAFAELVEKYHYRLLTFIHRLINDDSIVEDIGQDVFLNTYKALPKFDEEAGVPFSAWLFIAARNRVVSELRKKGRRITVSLDLLIEPADEKLSGMELLAAKEEHKAINDCLAQLAEPFRTVIIKSLQGDSLDQIARLQGISQGTVKSRLFRARTKLKVLVRQYFGGKGYEQI